MKNQVVNILTRTSGRPKAFSRCVASVNSQKYNGIIKHIILADDDASFKYASKLCFNVIQVEKEVRNVDYGIAHAPYNLYMNNLLDEVSEGFIIFLDDDDIFSSPDSISTIMSSADKDKLLVWRVKFPYGIIPQDWAFQAPMLIPSQITSCAFMFHSDHKWAAKWDEVKEADYRCAQRLSRLLGEVTKLDKVLTEAPTVGLGKGEDS